MGVLLTYSNTVANGKNPEKKLGRVGFMVEYGMQGYRNWAWTTEWFAG